MKCSIFTRSAPHLHTKAWLSCVFHLFTSFDHPLLSLCNVTQKSSWYQCHQRNMFLTWLEHIRSHTDVCCRYWHLERSRQKSGHLVYVIHNFLRQHSFHNFFDCCISINKSQTPRPCPFGTCLNPFSCHQKRSKKSASAWLTAEVFTSYPCKRGAVLCTYCVSSLGAPADMLPRTVQDIPASA